MCSPKFPRSPLLGHFYFYDLILVQTPESSTWTVQTLVSSITQTQTEKSALPLNFLIPSVRMKVSVIVAQ